MKQVVIALLVATGVAHADEPPPAQPSPPQAEWERGVPEPVQTQANLLYEEANDLYAKEAHKPALEKYEAALKLWDHPMIRYNMAVTLIRLDRVLDADVELAKALKFGAAPFTPVLYQQALGYKKLVGDRIATINASCDQTGTQIILDGKPWFACPGKEQVRVLNGEHVIVGERAGYMTMSRRVMVGGNGVANERIELAPIEEKVVYPYRRWIPWTITAGGGTVALAGLGFWVSGRRQLDQFRTQFVIACPNGCRPDLSDQPLLRSARDSGELKNGIGVTTMIVGGAIAIGGTVFALAFNKPHRFMPTMHVTPTPGGASTVAAWTF